MATLPNSFIVVGRGEGHKLSPIINRVCPKIDFKEFIIMDALDLHLILSSVTHFFAAQHKLFEYALQNGNNLSI